MVGLSDIPFVGKAVDRISEVTVEARIRGLRYILCYNGLVKDLKSEIKKIEVQEGRVSRRANEERANGKTVENHVMEWQNEVEEIKTRADELFKQRPYWNCFKVVLFPNPFSHFRLGRKAAHEAQNVAKLTVSGIELLTYEIAYLPADENIPISDTVYQKFGSREEAYGKLWEALVKVDGDPIIGIYGMPGVGKTRMMEHAWKDAKDKKVFDKVTRANVGSENFNLINLQDQLAGYLGCHLESENNEVHRASQLKNSLINGGKTLVILDDVWDQIPLKNIGIPLGDDISKGCKILLTSRKEDVCLRNDCKDPIKIETLTVDEAWDMFKNIVSTSKVNSLQDTSLAQKVCKECGALPLLIGAVGNALKFVSKDSWKNALLQLQNCDFSEIDGIGSQVYTCIQLSFRHLKNAAKTCLLLCSLFPEDYEIEIQMLEDLATGSQLLNRGGKLMGVVDNLKSSSLLLEGKNRGTVKMHDIIRDVTRSIAATDQQYAFLFIRGDWRFPVIDDYSTRKLIQLVESHSFGRLTGMVCPNLHTLWLECKNQSQQFSNNIFEGFGNLKVLVIKGMHIFPDQMSVQTFDKLTMLILTHCKLNEISLSIFPKNLETLRITNCRLPVPLDLSNLKYLRKLEVLSSNEIEMVPNAISALFSTLEELHIPGGFKISDAEGKRSVSISFELNKLTALTSLNILLEDSESCPSENIVANLLKFNIYVGNKFNRLRSLNSETRSVSFNHICIEGGGEALAERAEEMLLHLVKGSPNGLSNSSNREAFSDLRKLHINACQDMERLAWIPHYQVQQSQSPISFSKLTSLKIDSCWRLKYLFCARVANCLMQLEELHITDCPKLEVIIWNESANDGVIIKLPKLKLLLLYKLQSLKRFYGEIRGTSSSSATVPDNAATSSAGSDSLFDGMVAFPALESLWISYLETSEIWEKNGYRNNSFCQLKDLGIRNCPNLEFAIPLAMLPQFQNLEELEMYDCDSMTSEVESSSSSKESPLFDPRIWSIPHALVALRSIDLSYMPALTQTGLNSRRNLYPNLEILSLYQCNSLRNVFLSSSAKDLVHLKELSVAQCKIMSEIIGEEGEEERYNEFVFPELAKLELSGLPNFKSFCFKESLEAQATTRQSYLTKKVSFPKLVKLDLRVKTKTTLEGIELGSNDSASEIRKLVVESDNEVQLPHKWQLQLLNIEELILGNCWGHGRSGVGQSLINPYGTLSFQRLKEVKVSRCGLSALFSCSVFRNLYQLRKLKVTNCPLVEEIVRGENNILGTNEEIITLLQLESIELNDLSKLKSFSGSTSYAFNMPALRSIGLYNCPRMENFTCLKISTPLIPDFNTQFQQYLSDPIEEAVIFWQRSCSFCDCKGEENRVA